MPDATLATPGAAPTHPYFARRNSGLAGIEGPTSLAVDTARLRLDQHVQMLMQWHFSPETGAPYWLEAQKTFKFNPRRDVRSFDDMVNLFPPFDEEVFKRNSIEHLIPRGFAGKPYNVYLTGGTTSGAPSRRPNWNDYMIDYSEFSDYVAPEHFPLGAKWLMAGPSGPRRLPDAIRFLAQLRGGVCQAIDCDPVAVKGMVKAVPEGAQWYVNHVVGQIVRNLDTREFAAMFTSPPLLEEIALKRNLYECGIRGVFFGGTEISPEWMRIMKEQIGPGVGLYPTYGNTLMGLAKSIPVTPEGEYSVTYYAPQPRAVLRIVEPKNHEKVVEYGQVGQVEVNTLTPELFAPRFCERDEAIRRMGCRQFPWDGVGDVRPLGASEGKKIVRGVY